MFILHADNIGSKRTIVFKAWDSSNSLFRISEIHRSYHALQYSASFLSHAYGYPFNILLHHPASFMPKFDGILKLQIDGKKRSLGSRY